MEQEARLRLVIEDVNVQQVLEQNRRAAKANEDALEQMRQKAQQATKDAVEGMRKQEQAAIDAARAEAELVQQIIKQEKQIEALEKQRNSQLQVLEKLEKKYQRLGKAGNASAASVKKQMDILVGAIEKTSTELSNLEETNNAAVDSLDQMTGSVDRTNAKLNAARKSSGLLQKGMGLLKGGIAGLAAGLISLIGVGFTEFLNRSKEASEAWGKATAFVSGIFDELLRRLVPVGEAIFRLFQGQASLLDVGKAVVGVFGEQEQSLKEAGEAAVAYRNALKDLENSQRDFIVGEGELLTIIERRRRVSTDEARSIRERVDSLEVASRLERDLEQQRIRLAERNLELIRDRNTSLDGQLTVTDEVAQAERELIDLRRDAADREFADEMEIRSLRNEAVQQYKDRQAAIRDLQKQTESALEQLRRFQQDDASGIDKVRQDTIAAVGEVRKLEAVLRDLFEQQGREFNLDDEIAATIQQVERRGQQEIQRIQREQAAAAAAEERRRLDAEQQAALRRLDLQEELALTLADNNRRIGLSDTEAYEANEREKLNISIDFARRRLELLEDQSGLEAALLRADVENFQQQLEELNNTDLSFTERLREKIKEALSLSEEDFQAVTGLFANFGNFLIDSATLATERQIEQQERIIASYQDRVQETQSLLDEQRQLDEQGFANDVALFQEKLEAEQAALEKAENEKLALQRKQANAQLKIEAAQQASAYVTTVLNLLASESGKGIIGLIAVAAGGLALIGSIVAKARANAASFEPQRFRHGKEYVDGPGTGTSDSIPALLSRGERVVKFEDNQALGGRATTNEELVHFFQLGKQLSSGVPDFSVIDNKTWEVIKHGQQVSQLERERTIAMQGKAFSEAADRMANTVIEYWKTRPITYTTKNGTVREFTKGGTRIIQIIEE